MLPILRTSLWRPVRRVASPVDALFGDLDRWASRLWEDRALPELSFQPTLDVTEDEEAVRVRAEVPGVDPENLHVEVHEDTLSIRGEKKGEGKEERDGHHWSERCYGSFARSIRLPSYVERNKVEANYKDGILTVTLPKVDQAKPKQIPIKAG